MAAPITNGRSLSLRALAKIYGLSHVSLREWERQGVDLENPFHLHHAMANSYPSLYKAHDRLWRDKYAPIRYCVAIREAVKARGLDPVEVLEWCESDPDADC